MFAFAVGFGPLVMGLIPSAVDLRHPAVQAVCLGGIVIAPIYVIMPRRWGYEFKSWAFEAVLLYAIAGPLFCEYFISDLVPSMLTIYMMGPIGAAYYLSSKRAIPFIAFGSAAILYKSTGFNEDDAMLRGVILTIITASSSLMLVAMMRNLVRAVEINREISERDPLTGTFNLHRFETRLPDEIARSKRGGDGFALIQFDLDDFKSVNETYNHSVGDDVLVATAEAIQSTLTPADLLVRRGGDEFIVIAPVLPDRDVSALTETARSRIAGARSGICPTLVSDASGGYVVHREGESADEILARVDEVLHDAKAKAPHRRRSSSAESTRPVNLRLVTDLSSAIRDNRRQEVADLRDDPISGAYAIAWRTSGITIILFCIAVTSLGALGRSGFELSPQVIALDITWIFGMVPVMLLASVRQKRSMYLTHVLAITTLAMIALTARAVGASAPAIIEFYVLAALIVSVLLPVRQAAGYSAVALGSYATFLLQSDIAFSEVRVVLTVTNISLVGAVMALTRSYTIAAARRRAGLARTDALTGLPNMRLLRDRLRREIDRCKETGESIALLMLDLDDFKAVNDRFSHTLGDRTLVAVANALEGTVRHIDMPARRGGDEFAVLMTDAIADDAELAAQRIRAAIVAARLDVVPTINPNASVGWVVWGPGESIAELIDRADHALHSEKSESRLARVPKAAAAGTD